MVHLLSQIVSFRQKRLILNHIKTKYYTGEGKKACMVKRFVHSAMIITFGESGYVDIRKR